MPPTRSTTSGWVLDKLNEAKRINQGLKVKSSRFIRTDMNVKIARDNEIIRRSIENSRKMLNSDKKTEKGGDFAEHGGR
jgi:hypothetical protein